MSGIEYTLKLVIFKIVFTSKLQNVKKAAWGKKQKSRVDGT